MNKPGRNRYVEPGRSMRVGLRKKILVVTGGREFGEPGRQHTPAERRFVYDVLKELWISMGCRVLVHGKARGADTVAGKAGLVLGYQVIEEPALWDVFGRGAGQIRNAFMLHKHRPALIVAFPGGRGTRHMCGLAMKTGIRLVDRRRWKPTEAAKVKTPPPTTPATREA